MPKDLSLGDLRSLVSGTAVAIRGRATLEPAGGPGDKVFPPTHSVGDRAREVGAKYARETRRLATGPVPCVLLDSVQSQANRMEEALEELWRKKRINLPVVKVDFSQFPEVGEVTSLSAPHRVADAILRDSTLDKTPFRASKVGKSFADATPRNATELFKVCPTALVFGMWDSTGPKGGLGSKFARALVSEIVGVGAEFGVKTESRIDPLGIVKDAGTIYVSKDRGEDGQLTWTSDPGQAETEDGKPKKWGKKDKAGSPSSIVHGNVPPSIVATSGGVTIDYATQTVVLSLSSLRKLGFGENGENNLEAQTVLAALGLLAILAATGRGHDLRSRCLLVPRPSGALRLESVRPDGGTDPVTLTHDGALELYAQAVEALPKRLRFVDAKGAPLEAGEPLVVLSPGKELVKLVKASRTLVAVEDDVEE